MELKSYAHVASLVPRCYQSSPEGNPFYITYRYLPHMLYGLLLLYVIVVYL